MIIPKFPDLREIDAMIKKVEKIRLRKAILNSENEAIKEGLEYCIVKLLAHQKELRETGINSNPYFTPETEEELSKLKNIYREQLRPWKFLRNVGARCIAILCIDWLNGQNDGTWIKMK